MIKTAAIATGFSLLFSFSVSAQEWVIALGADDQFDNLGVEASALTLEYHSAPFLERRGVELAWLAALQVDTAEDAFLGAGVYSHLPLGPRRSFAELSLALGAYHQGPDDTRPADDLQFRSSLGIGTEINDRARISLSIDHLLNTDFENYEPGSEAVMLRLTRRF